METRLEVTLLREDEDQDLTIGVWYNRCQIDGLSLDSCLRKSPNGWYCALAEHLCQQNDISFRRF
jgi:hypothetical protein